VTQRRETQGVCNSLLVVLGTSGLADGTISRPYLVSRYWCQLCMHR